MRIKESTVAKFTARKRVGMFDETQRVMSMATLWAAEGMANMLTEA